MNIEDKNITIYTTSKKPEFWSSNILQEAWRTSDSPIGTYIINEEFAPPEVKSVQIMKDKLNGKPVGKAIYQSGGVRNRNGRIYDTNDLIREVHCPRIQELLRTKNLFCEAGHPIDTSLQRQSTIDWRNSNCKILTLDVVGNNVEGMFTPSNTEYGKAFAMDLLEGVIPAFSLRALGSIRQTRLGAQVTDLRMITYDQVIYPSHSNAYMTELLKEESEVLDTKAHSISEASLITIESGNRLIPVNGINETADLEHFVDSNSKNVQFIKAYLNCGNYKNIVLSENKSYVVLEENDSTNKIAIDLESYIARELMNYTEKINNLY